MIWGKRMYHNGHRGRRIPYRGEVLPKVYGHRSPPSPAEKNVNFLFWFLFVVAGLVIFYFAVILAAQTNFAGVFVFVIYLMFALVAFFAMKDLKNIKMITPDIDDEDQDDNDDPAKAEDYFQQIEWMHTHRKGRQASHWDAPEPQRIYRIVRAKGNKIVARQNSFIFELLLGIGILAVVSSIFKFSSSLTNGIIVIGSLIFLFIYLIRD
jgi:hypothetical protein